MLLLKDPLSGLLALAPSPAVRGLHLRQIAATRGAHRFRSWLAGRRSGKSYAAAVWLLGGKRGEISVYCARTLKSAKGIMLAVFVELNEKYRLGLDIRASTGTITEPNGHVIQLYGLHDQGAADLVRGLSRLRRAFVDECFVKGTPIQPVGDVVRTSCRPAPSRLYSIDGVTCTPDHPFLTPEGWIRAEDITTETVLCVWDNIRPERPLHSEQDMFQGLPLCERISCDARERLAHAQASAKCKELDTEGKRNSRAASDLRRKVLGDLEAYWAQADSQRGERPWRYVAGIPARECHWLADGCGDSDPERLPAAPLQVGPSVRIEEAGNRGGRDQSLDAEGSTVGRAQNGVAGWKRVVSVEIHERGGVGRYSEVCPDGRVYNLTTESGLYFAGGRLVHNCGAFTDELLKYCVESVLQPMLLDLQGSMCVAGTPGVIPKGYFYDLTGNPGLEKPLIGRWKTNHWTYRDNPHVPGELVLSEALSANGWTPEHATFKREYGGIWCEDAEALIYRYTEFARSGWASPPSSGMTVLAIDFGVVDRCAFVVGRQAWDARPHVHVLHAFAKSNMGLPEIAAKARELRERFQVNKIYADEGALGKGYANHLRDQYRLPIEKAEKLHKRSRIDAVRGRIDSDTLHLCEEAAPLLDEWRSLCWDELHEDHHPRMLDDLSDATCYLLACPEFSAYEAPIAPVTPIDPRVAIKEAASRKAMERSGLGRISGI